MSERERADCDPGASQIQMCIQRYSAGLCVLGCAGHCIVQAPGTACVGCELEYCSTCSSPFAWPHAVVPGREHCPCDTYRYILNIYSQRCEFGDAQVGDASRTQSSYSSALLVRMSE